MAMVSVSYLSKNCPNTKRNNSYNSFFVISIKFYSAWYVEYIIITILIYCFCHIKILSLLFFVLSQNGDDIVRNPGR